MRSSLLFACWGVVQANRIYGVAPELQLKYVADPDGNWRCLLNPEIVLRFDQVNDNICDCPDGSDEPGTNACEFVDDAFHWFYCENRGYFPGKIENYKLNDGVCDYDICCDGSDEYLSGKCPDRCKEVRKQYENHLASSRLMLDKALQSREKLVQEARERKERVEAKAHEARESVELTEKQLLSVAAKGVSAVLEESEFVKEAKALFEQFEARFESLKQQLVAQKYEADRLEKVLVDLRDNYNPNFNDHAVKKAISEFAEHLLNKDESEEGSLELVYAPFLQKLAEGYTAGKCATSGGPIEPTFANVIHSYYHKFVSKFKPSEAQSAPQEMQEVRKVPQAEIEALEKKLNAANAELLILTDQLLQNYGPDDIFRAVENEWVTLEINSYTYKLGFLDAIYQDTTLVGRFAGYDGERLHYKAGAKCWNGPQRSAVVEIQCGDKNELVLVSEPEKCSYSFVLVSPLGCEPQTDEQIAQSFKVDPVKLL